MSITRAVSRKACAWGPGSRRVSLDSVGASKHPRIFDATREWVADIAAELGYRPNPELNKAMAIMGCRINSEGVIGCIHTTERDQWGGLETVLFDSAQNQAKEFGYILEPFWISDLELNPAKLNRTLGSRGIEGLLVPSIHPAAFERGLRTLPMDWEKFSGVEIADTLMEPSLNSIRFSNA